MVDNAWEKAEKAQNESQQTENDQNLPGIFR